MIDMSDSGGTSADDSLPETVGKTTDLASLLNIVTQGARFVESRTRFIGFSGDEQREITLRLMIAVLFESCIAAFKALPGVKASPAEVLRDRGITFVHGQLLADSNIEGRLGSSRPTHVREFLANRRDAGAAGTTAVPENYTAAPKERIVIALNMDKDYSDINEDVTHELAHASGVPGRTHLGSTLMPWHDLSHLEGSWLNWTDGPYDTMIEACNP